jgi:hypothetical protein
MGLYEKIEEIRSKPEHIRMRYVWVMVVVTMIFVVLIWIFSLMSSQNNGSLIPKEINTPNIINQPDEQKDSTQQQKSTAPQGNLQQDTKNSQ